MLVFRGVQILKKNAAFAKSHLLHHRFAKFTKGTLDRIVNRRLQRLVGVRSVRTFTSKLLQYMYATPVSL